MEFWDYTPAEVTEMCKWAIDKQEQERAFFAVITYNAGMITKENGKPFEMSDFISETETKEETDEERLKRLDLECQKWKNYIDNCRRSG